MSDLEKRAVELAEEALALPDGQERGDRLYAANVYAQLALAEAQRGARDALTTNAQVFNSYVGTLQGDAEHESEPPKEYPPAPETKP